MDGDDCSRAYMVCCGARSHYREEYVEDRVPLMTSSSWTEAEVDGGTSRVRLGPVPSPPGSPDAMAQRLPRLKAAARNAPQVPRMPELRSIVKPACDEAKRGAARSPCRASTHLAPLARSMQPLQSPDFLDCRSGVSPGPNVMVKEFDLMTPTSLCTVVEADLRQTPQRARFPLEELPMRTPESMVTEVATEVVHPLEITPISWRV
eukprot:s2876_g3.t1